MKHAIIALLTILLLFAANQVLAHPGSGIVAGRQGNIYFVDTGSGVYKIDRNGKLTRLSGPAYHWMAIDIDGRLKNATLPVFSSDNRREWVPRVRKLTPDGNVVTVTTINR